jgi:hypothetical protein
MPKVVILIVILDIDTDKMSVVTVISIKIFFRNSLKMISFFRLNIMELPAIPPRRCVESEIHAVCIEKAPGKRLNFTDRQNPATQTIHCAHSRSLLYLIHFIRGSFKA